MNTFVYLMIALICFISQSYSLKLLSCIPNCKDRINSASCVIMHRRTNCSEVLWKIFCPLTCQVCQPCLDNLPLSGNNVKSISTTKCEIETCVDEMSPVQCFVIEKILPDGCKQYGMSCRKTCKLCKECPSPPPACTDECEDKNNHCNGWKENGFCNESSQHYEFMQEECPLSCNLCKLCPTEAPPNTALPPAKPQCQSSGCEDSDPSCEHWAENGYCNVSKGFPFTRVTCPKSCGVCTQCPTELPPPKPTEPSCSKECNETTASCGYWKGEGYCNETSEFYSHMERDCPITCGMCNPCPTKSTNDE